MRNKFPLKGILAAIGMIVIILDTQTAVNSAGEGVALCINTVIPSLLPFILLSRVIVMDITGKAIPFLRPVGKICHIPEGSDALFLIGCVGGYPVGAQCVRQAYENGNISRDDAQRMVAFCNNAGPAFIFGIASVLFDSGVIPWVIWLIQINAAIITGILLPSTHTKPLPANQSIERNITGLIFQSIKSMAVICGWVILSKILIGYVDLWLLSDMPPILRIPLIGIIELSNGCVQLKNIEAEHIKFIMIGSLLSFGGFSIWMQTASAVGDLDKRTFYLGKVMQSALSITLSFILSPMIFPGNISINWFLKKLLWVVLCAIAAIMLIKKVVALQQKVLYNKKKPI